MSGSAEGRARAQQIIREIVREHGFVQESTLQLVNSLVSQDARREIEEALLAKDVQLGSSVLTLARNLYTSQARFVFELLQNADDNQYTRGQDPCVVFRVYPDRIAIECNEDGFTRENLRAICSIGKSSKTGSQGYIGEKGIGFKSVFMAAWKVHIQFGDYSFDFVHRNGDSGMGMINPIWQERRDPDLPFELTRITLYLHDHIDLAERERDRQLINEQFLELQDALLLFLRKLRKIEVSFHDEEGIQTDGIIFTRNNIEASDAAVIERTCTNAAQNRKRTYHIVKHIATGLARSENRSLSEAEEATRSFATSEIVLAFPVIKDPVTSEEVPVIEPQEVFAYLPVKKMGFNFLIQADFVTLANRQDIVMTSRRNQGLIEAIADAFIAGVLQLCQRQTLEYQWMRYLPLENSYPWDSLWMDLISSIKFKLNDLAVFRSRGGSTCRTIKDLFCREPVFNDQHGAPLFADLRPEVYLSDSYSSPDIEILKNFGLGRLTFDKIIAMVRQDLWAGPEHSRIRGVNADEVWHTRAYEALNIAWEYRWSLSIQSLKQLNIIPLQDGMWASSDSGDIFYPTYGDVVVPKGLGMRLVDPTATRNEARCAFFDNLGVRRINAPIVAYIRERILRQPVGPPAIVNLQSSVERMSFLFLTQLVHPEEEGDLSDQFMVYNHLDEAKYPFLVDFYISNDGPYGAELFLRQRRRQVNCVNSRYFEEIPSVAPGSNRTLHQWMHQHLGIREHLRLVSSDRRSLSVECLDTARTRAAEFLGFLGHIWPFEGDIVAANPRLLTALRMTPVLCMDEEREELRNTYLPLQPLLDVHRRFLGDEYFPFIQWSELPGQDHVPHFWSFLCRSLSVGFQDNVSFRLQLMRFLKVANADAGTLDNPSRVVDLYQSLDACLRMSQDPEREREKRKILDTFDAYNLIFVPRWNSNPACWTTPKECLWDAPSDFTTKVPIKEIYTSTFHDLSTELGNMTGLFCGTLNIFDIDWFDVIVELEELKRQRNVSGEVVRQLFGILSEKSPTEEDDIEEIRDVFEAGALIYFHHNGPPGWYKPSECVWSDTTHIHGKIAINAQYNNLKDLFVETLRVPQLDLTMVLDQLLAARSLDLPVSEVKELLKTLNSFLCTESSPPNPSRLLHARIFPVREPSSGNVVLCTSTTQFALVDREGPPSRFIESVRVLDFTLQEIRHLKPFLAWTRLESRYLSRCMKEISRVGDGVYAPISQPHRDLRRKAYALLRIAAALNSPRYAADATGLYHVLCTAVTLECGVISSSLSFEQDDVMHEIALDQSELHIDETSPLTIYVPNDTESQECCFKFDLPHRFASWMMTDPTTGARGNIEDGTINVVNSILNCLISTTGRILEKEGIPTVPGIAEIIFPSLELDEPAESIAMAAAADLRGQGEVVPRTPDRLPENEGPFSPDTTVSPPASPGSPGVRESPPDHLTPLTDHGDYDNEDDRGSPNAGDLIPPPRFHIPEQVSASQYRQLLEGVVAMAERTNLPNNFEDISTVFQGLLVEDDPFEGVYYDYNSHDWEHKKRVGAAGELFVFKILSCIQDLEFGLQNWRSRIRGYVRVLPEFRDLRAWPGRETSDQVYDDINGVFTGLMISLGYLDADHWQGKTPRYYIEVKCTTGPCETPCIVSQHQVDLMERTSNGLQGNENQSAVYALFRVFRLGRNSMGLKIYIDPAEQRRLGKLLFTSEKYFVIPAARNQ